MVVEEPGSQILRGRRRNFCDPSNKQIQKYLHTRKGEKVMTATSMCSNLLKFLWFQVKFPPPPPNQLLQNYTAFVL